MSRSRVSEYEDTAWFQAAPGDVFFFQWLVDRCYELGDVKSPQSPEATQRLHLWFGLRQSLRLELGLTTTDSVVPERVSKRRKNDLFDLKSMLECISSCTIDSIASHARVPVLRFRFERIGVEYKCDLCFDNELGVRNTRLLAAYASFDDRARELGLAVKHWAKQRGIIDTSSGFLSSNSFDPGLLELAEVQPEFYDRKSVAFCEDFEIAQSFHKATVPNSDYLDASLPALLFGFFKFFATQFDYVNQVVAIRSPHKSISKPSLWGTKSKTWRMSIQDPLQTTRDVGGVLHLSSQCKFTYELHRS